MQVLLLYLRHTERGTTVGSAAEHDTHKHPKDGMVASLETRLLPRPHMNSLDWS